MGEGEKVPLGEYVLLREKDDRVGPAAEDDVEVAETDRVVEVECGPPLLVAKNGFWLKSGECTGETVLEELGCPVALARSLPFQDVVLDDKTPAAPADTEGSRDRLVRRSAPLLKARGPPEGSSVFRAVSLKSCKLTLALRPPGSPG